MKKKSTSLYNNYNNSAQDLKYKYVIAYYNNLLIVSKTFL